MLHKVTRVLAIAALGWLVACEAGALTVGRARGAVLLGRPLDLSIPVTLDAQESEPCASADVFYGEEKLQRAPAVRWEPGSGGQGVLRLTSPVPVDEPMITVYLRVGCAQSTTRRIVMLSEPPPQGEAVAPPVRIAPPVVQSPAVPAPGAAAVPSAQAPSASSVPGVGAPQAAAPLGPRRPRPTPADAAVAALRTERELAAARPAPRPSVRPAAPVSRARRPDARQAQPRLKLEPVELGPERDPVLRLSSELRSELATDPQRRQAAAALWAALQKGPDEILQDSLRLRAVEGEIRTLRDTTQQNAAAVAQMRAQVEKARAERSTAGTMVAVLGAVLLALLALLIWRWYTSVRMSRVGRWFEQHGESQLSALAPARKDGGPAAQPDSAPVSVDVPLAPVAATAAATTAAATTAAATTAAAAVRRKAGAAPAPAEEFQASRGGSMRMVGVEELIDVHDKADFFLSIGEYDQAIAVLEAHVHDQVETSALAWMDLLELYHSLGRRVDYERLRSEFRQRFTAQVPDFEHFDQPTASLENYGRALSRIVALWPSQRVLDVIEESIFRKPGLPGAEPFSLEAYRELVLLYHVAKELSHQDGKDGQPSRFHDTSLQPLNAPERAEPAVDVPVDRDLLLIPPASARVGVDIDIGSLGDAAAAPPPPKELPSLDFDLGDDFPSTGAVRKNATR